MGTAALDRLLAVVLVAQITTGVAGGELPAANGRPCRLVVPTRRGLDRIKWVTEVTIA